MTILQLKTFKTQIIANSRALIYLGLYGSVAEPISHTVLTYPTCREEFDSRGEQIFHVASQL